LALMMPSGAVHSIIPGRGLLPASPESITTGGNDTARAGVMDSGLAGKSPRPGMTK